MRIVRVRGVPEAAALADAARVIAGGGTLIFPTDTVYGIGCAPGDARAVAAVFAAKRRPESKPLAIHLAQPQDARAFAARLRAGARRLMDAFWPGPIAIVVERADDRAAAAALGGATISLRCPDDAICEAILRATGPLAATSANISGEAAFTGEDDDVNALPDADLAFIAGPTKRRQESTVVDCSTDVVRVLRIGAVTEAEIAAALAGKAAFEPSSQR